jgi:hypothetical protein
VWCTWPLDLGVVVVCAVTHFVHVRRTDGGQGTHFKGPVDMTRHIYRTQGIAGLYVGMGATVWRETPSYAVYFASFEFIGQVIFVSPKLFSCGRSRYVDSKHERASFSPKFTSCPKMERRQAQLLPGSQGP